MVIRIYNPDGGIRSTIEEGSTSYRFLYEVVTAFDLAMLDNDRLIIVRTLPSGSDQREALRTFANEYQRAQAELSTSYEELAYWGGFFSKYGEELGLSEEFKENGII